MYLERYTGAVDLRAVLLGMNPGPWGMAQTGVPFGEVGLVRDWLGIECAIDRPENEHPKRPVEGFGCERSEVSGSRLWGWARDRYRTPQAFFNRFFVANYCPLMFLEESGRNRTPDRLPRVERLRLTEICDRALRETVELLSPRYVIGVGRYAERRAIDALDGLATRVDRILHPSPANPSANRNWRGAIEDRLATFGLDL